MLTALNLPPTAHRLQSNPAHGKANVFLFLLELCAPQLRPVPLRRVVHSSFTLSCSRALLQYLQSGPGTAGRVGRTLPAKVSIKQLPPPGSTNFFVGSSPRNACCLRNSRSRAWLFTLRTRPSTQIGAASALATYSCKTHHHECRLRHLHVGTPRTRIHKAVEQSLFEKRSHTKLCEAAMEPSRESASTKP